MNGSRNKIHGIRHTVILIHHGSVTLVGARGDRLRPGVQSFEDRCSIRCCVVEAGRESSAVNEFGGQESFLDGDCWIVASSEIEQVAGP